MRENAFFSACRKKRFTDFSPFFNPSLHPCWKWRMSSPQPLLISRHRHNSCFAGMSRWKSEGGTFLFARRSPERSGGFLAHSVLFYECVYTNHRSVNHFTDSDSYMLLCSKFALTTACSVTAHLHHLVSQITRGKRMWDFGEYSQNTLTKLIIFSTQNYNISL